MARKSVFARNGRLRHQRRLNAAFVAIDNGATLWKAASTSGMSVSGFYYNHNRRGIDNRFARLQLSYEEERKVVEVLRRHSDRGRDLTREDLMDAVEMLVRSFPEERRKKIRFVNSRPGRSFCDGFAKRHANSISFKKPSKQEAVRYRAINADNLTTHFASMERLVSENNIYPARFANLDEAGVTPGNDKCRVNAKKVYCTRYSASRASRPESIEAEFGNVKRVTLMAVIFASGEYGKPMFIFEGTKMRYRTVLGSNGTTFEESILDCLPRGSLLTTRKDVAGVDKDNFVRWAHRFVNEVKPLTANNRKVLLTYDAYRSHMTLEALEILNAGGVIAYAFPAHTSGSTQPLDVGVFSPWKTCYREELRKVMVAERQRKLDEFDFATLLSVSFRQAFTHSNILGAFRGAGLHPLDEMKLIGRSRPFSDAEPERIVDVETICAMLDEKRKLDSPTLLAPSKVLKSGFIDTSKGVTLRSIEAMEMVRLKEERIRRKRRVESQKKRARENAEIESAEDRKEERERHVRRALAYRVSVYGDPPALPRSLKSRRLVARERFKHQHEANWSDNEGDAPAPGPPWMEMSVDQWAIEEESR